jgi:translation initiation factor IF-2
MSEVNTPRLMAAAKEFNIGTNTLIDFLVSKGINEELKASTKLTETMYRILQSEFQQDKVAHEKAMQIDLPKGANVSEPKKKKDEQDLLPRKKQRQNRLKKQNRQKQLQLKLSLKNL